MSMKAMIARQYDYGCWARAKILREAKELSDEQYFAKSGERSLHTLLMHTLGTDWVWRSVAQTGTLNGTYPNEESHPTLAEVEAGWQGEEAAFQSFLQGLSEADLEVGVETVSPAGQAFTFIRWEMLQHMLLHGMQHRTEAATILTSYGRSPGDLDYLFFMIGRE